MKLKGIGASNGASIAKVFKLEHQELKVTKKSVENSDKEIQKLEKSIDVSIVEINKIKDYASKNIGAEEAAVFDAHIQVASDPAMKQEIETMIKNNEVNATFAVKTVSSKYIDMFASMDDEYMKERVSDIKDVTTRIMNNLEGIKTIDLSSINEEVIIVAIDLTPSETAVLNKKYVKGFLVDIGGKTSHAGIMARSLEIPAVVGLKEIMAKAKHGEMIAMDGETGDVIVNPSKQDIKDFEAKIEKLAQEKKENEMFRNKPTVTKDGQHLELAANIGSPKDVEGANGNDAEGVGLFRSEFLYMDASTWPSEEEQFQSYKEVLEGMNGKRVVVRTLDIGGDKTLTYYKFPEEMNPFLGYRAIRFCLDRPEVFRTQLRALLRASVHGKLAIMFPMIATVEEFLKAKQFVEEAKKELKKEKVKVSDDIEIGMMVEIPAAVAISRQFAKHADFFSIGTNDLMQYTMAADRMSEKVSYLYQPLNPSILHMINMTIQGAHAEGKWVGMCGEMAGDKNAVPLLVGMGLDEFSMSASSILATRKQIANINQKEAATLVSKALAASTEAEVKKLVDEFNAK